MRNNPTSGHYQGYYRLVESYRNEDDRICHRTLLYVGFSDAIQGKNTFDKPIAVPKCSKPIEKLRAFYDILQIRHYPFRKKKSVVHKLTLKKMKPTLLMNLRLLSCKMG